MRAPSDPVLSWGVLQVTPGVRDVALRAPSPQRHRVRAVTVRDCSRVPELGLGPPRCASLLRFSLCVLRFEWIESVGFSAVLLSR
jgi:hypothetical protein